MINKSYEISERRTMYGNDGWSVRLVNTCSCCDHQTFDFIAYFEEKIDAEKYVAFLNSQHVVEVTKK